MSISVQLSYPLYVWSNSIAVQALLNTPARSTLHPGSTS